MKKTFYLLFAAVSALVLGACSSDDDAAVQEDFVVAFENPSLSFSAEEDTKDVNLEFSTTAPHDGTVTIGFTPTNVVYGQDEDFVTTPNAMENEIIVDFSEGDEGASFSFRKLKDAIEGNEKSITFQIQSVSLENGLAGGTTSILVSFEETAALGGTMAPEVGGPNQPNQVYVDLSAQNQTAVSRDSWDLGFYSGDEFRVIINGSLYMAAAELDAIDIDAVTEEDVAELQTTVAVGTFDPTNTAYIDSPEGDLSKTAISEISAEDSENKVYLLNLGSEVGTEDPDAGSVDITDDPRGWMKIRILQSENGYTLQYAPLDSDAHTEVTITKDAAYNFQYFSLKNEEEVMAQPAQGEWDLLFTVFTNEITGAGSYGYADYIVTNRLDGVEAYQVENESVAYADFNSEGVDATLFEEDQRAIGSNWRNGGGPGTLPSLKENVYFVIKDSAGNLYKLKFTSLLDENGTRGYPSFEYALIQ
ncbi:HmuY family protein [Autumnicola musiva]|uniref:HmuY family protein n=1 Tax=Autumnicola musiva TaxID=3075589 RepID=A0ABU3DB36_9FLAO|nr:HmuY family protein [Zunongwangia sp. F117]MDT0678747.1 HmuY family protein [Zunongwangia sp. F117]